MKSPAVAIWIAWASLAAQGLAVAAEGPITIGVSPPRFELEIGDGPVSDSMRVFNFGSKTTRIRVSVHDWELDEKSRVQLLAPTEQSLEQWMIVNPLVFEIPPGQSQTVRFAIRPKLQPRHGEHRAMIYLRQDPDPDTLPAAGELRVTGKIGVAVYGYAGPVERIGSLNGINVEAGPQGLIAGFDISSIGQAYVRMTGHYVLWPAGALSDIDSANDNKTESASFELPEGALAIGRLPHLPVLSDTRRVLPLSIRTDLPPGEYTLQIEGDLSGAPIDTTVPFSVSREHEGFSQ